MTNEIFREMAEQMRPDEDARAALRRALAEEAAPLDDADRAGSSPDSPTSSARSAHLAPRVARRGRRPRASNRSPGRPAIVAAVAGACAIALTAVAALPLLPWFQHGADSDVPGATVGTGTDDPGQAGGGYAEAYAALAAIHERQTRSSDDGSNWLKSLFQGSGGEAAGDSGDTAGGSQPSMEAAASADGLASGDYSGTNTQVVGIDEGDLVKTDGESIFIAGASSIRVVRADGAGSAEVSRIDVSQAVEAETGDPMIRDLMLSGEVLAALVTTEAWRSVAEPYSDDIEAAEMLAYSVVSDTLVALWDVADPAAPRHLTTLSQQGTYVSSRLLDGVLYTVSNHWTDVAVQPDAADPASYIPCVGEADSTAPVAESAVAVLPDPSQPSYALVTAVDLAGGERVGELAVLGGAETVYMSADNLYLAGLQWSLDGGTTTSNLARVPLDGPALSLAASSGVSGSLLNQFALDEFDGHLRVVTDSWEGAANTVRLVVLDASLTQVGAVDPLVVDESVQSVRFIGAYGYVVTFKQVDPLFAVDLSNPAAPRVTSELKIPGFSSYLHPWGQDRLLGLGQAGDDAGLIEGAKLSMFDISDPADVSEVDSLNLAGVYMADSDHRALWVDVERGLIGFGAVAGQRETYLVFSYGLEGFALEADVAPPSTRDPNYANSWLGWVTRGLRIGEDLYICSGGGVTVLALDGFKQLAAV